MSALPAYFISDLHLQASRQDITAAFENFLQLIAADAKSIYILGDFFEAWIGDDNDSALIFQITQALKTRSDSGCKLYFLHGNRDFLVGNDFAQRAGMTILPENTLIDLAGVSTLLLHGDSLCTSDVEYQQFRKKVRNPDWQKKMLAYPLWLRKLIAAYLRYRSRKANANKAENIMDVDRQAVEGSFRDTAVTRMIHGHTHRPNRHQYHIDGKECERIVLGDWDKKGWYLKADGDSLELLSFPLAC